MLLHGVANPVGEDSGYNGLYYTKPELESLAHNLFENTDVVIPVKAEHTGQPIGHVVSGFIGDNGCLNCVLKIDDSSVDGAIAAGLVRNGIASELSLGYAVDVHHSDDKYEAKKKTLLEISLVRKGARQHCYVYSYDDGSGTISCKSLPTHQDAWFAFDMQ